MEDDDQNEKIKTPTKTKRSFGPSRNTSNVGSARGSVRGSEFISTFDYGAYADESKNS